MIDEEGGISEVVQVDVTKEESCKAAVAKTVELFGTVHILVNIGMLIYCRLSTKTRCADKSTLSWRWRCDGRCHNHQPG